MKVINSYPISPFGGLNLVLKDFNKLGIDHFLNNHFPSLPNQSKYSWKDLLYSYWSVFFCGGDCAEDLSANLKHTFTSNPFIKVPSPDRILERLKLLALPSHTFTAARGNSKHHFSFNDPLNQINIKLLKRLSLIKSKNNILDYDNTILFTDKADAANTYKKRYGYCPGVALIGRNVVYVENRNGNSNPETLQKDTLRRMFDTLKSNNIHIGAFRADGASYNLLTLAEISANVDKFYIRAKMSDSLNEAINEVEKWSNVLIDNRKVFRGSAYVTPFEKIAKRTKQEHLLKQYRLVITKEKRDDGQVNLFTGEAYNYRAILTNDFDKTDDEVVFFYNRRGATEREFDILKNDFGWNNMPFSKLEYNTVFLIITSMCRNLYQYIITQYSKIYKNLSPKFRIKKFIFRFICIPAKWIKSGRMIKLRLYGNIYFKT
ncbi:IS1380 family transposase ISPto6 [subsurface metagenome]